MYAVCRGLLLADVYEIIIALCGDVLSYPYYRLIQRCSIFPYGSLDECVESVTI